VYAVIHKSFALFLYCFSPDTASPPSRSCHSGFSQKPLQDVIKQAEAAGELWTRNWDTFPLPMVGLKANNTQNKASPSPSPKAVNSAKGNKRKWQRQVVREDSDESDESDPFAKAKKMQRAQRFGAGHALGAVADSKPLTKGRTMKQRLQPGGFYSGGAGIVTKAHLTLGPGGMWP
jgi:hypothetical protein